MSRYETARKKHNELKKEVLSFYSKGHNPECVRCGFIDIRALSIDHINGNGHYHRQQLKKKGITSSNFYKWLIDNHFPKGYQTLCMNCQFIKRFERDENGLTGAERNRRLGIY